MTANALRLLTLAAALISTAALVPGAPAAAQTCAGDCISVRPPISLNLGVDVLSRCHGLIVYAGSTREDWRSCHAQTHVLGGSGWNRPKLATPQSREEPHLWAY